MTKVGLGIWDGTFYGIDWVNKGDIVLMIQSSLTLQGFDTKGVDGDFGKDTEAAVKAFQIKKGLDPDGVVGGDTWKALSPSDLDSQASKPPATSSNPKPKVTWISSPNYSSRNGAKITHIVKHHTDAPTVEGTIAWFQNPDSRVSAHYIIDRDGSIYQMVDDANKAWHCYLNNGYTIGQEHVGVNAQGGLTPEQEKASIALDKHLMSEYHIPKENIRGHHEMPGDEHETECPGNMFGGGSVQDWVKKNL